MVEVGEDGCGNESCCPSGSNKCFTMDESFLNDLLECSVCLEQLDSSSKVLPCQHTFCKRCLHEIVNSHKELRCPECRILVDVKIEELPCNILLVRLLEGIKNNVRPKRAVPSSLESSSPIVRGCRPESPSPPQHPQLPAQVNNSTTSEFLRTAVPKPVPQPCPCAKALYPYEAKVPGDLSFRKGDMILLRKRVDQNWFYGELGEKSGFVPASFVQVVVPITTHVPQCKALYDFQISNSCEEKECLLTFGKGDILTVIRRIDDHWAEGKLRERIGIFPISFVEMNAAARALMKLSVSMISSNSSNILPLPAPTSDSCFVPAMSSVIAPNVSAASTCQETSPSISPPTVTSVAISSPHFSSAFTSPVHSIISSSLGIGSESQGSTSMLCTEPLNHQRPTYSHAPADDCSADEPAHSEQQSNLFRPLSTPSPVFVAPPMVSQRSESMPCGQASHDVDASAPMPMVHFSSENCQTPSRNNTHVHVPNFYLALYSYRPQKEDELELRKGELYTVTEKCQDGWYKGTSLRTSQSGVFPGNYVQLAKSAVLQTQLMTSTNQPHASSTSPPPVTMGNCCQPKAQATSDPSVHSLNISFPNSSNCLSMVSRAPSPVTFSNAMHQQPQRIVRAMTPGAQAIYKSSEMQSKNAALSQSRMASMSPWNTDYSSVPTSSPLVTEFPPRTVTLSPTHMLPYQVGSGCAVSCSVLGENLTPTRYCVSQPSTPLTNTSTNPFVVTAGPSTVSGSCSPVATTSGPSSQARLDKHKEKKEKEIVSLMKRLTKRKSKSPPPSDFSCDNPSFVDLTASGTALATVHVRSTSCPSEALGSHGVSHKKTGSFDSCGNNEAPRPSSRPKQPAPLVRERFRCIVPYPPNSDYELELKVGDIVYVHKKRDDGWFKGTLQRTGKTGLFPSSFVEGF